MTESADAGSVEQPSAVSAGTPATQAEVADNGSAATSTPDPFSGLSEGTRKWVETKGYKSVEDALSGGMNAESRLGTAVTPPAQDAPQEEWDKFHARLGRPEKPEQYEFKRPEGLPENMPYNEDLANTSKTWMYEAGLTPRQSQIMHDKFAQFGAAEAQKAIEAQGKAVEATHDDLVRDWGPTESDGFKSQMELAGRAAKQLGLVEAFKETGILLPDGALTNPQIARAMAVVGDKMFREDTLADGSGIGGENPWKTDNVSLQSRLVKEDPDRARRFIKDAGKDPALYRL